MRWESSAMRQGQERHDVVVAAKLNGIGREVGNLGLNHLFHTEPGTSVRTADMYRGQRLLGAVEPTYGTSVALLLGSQNDQVPLRRVLIAPHERGSGLYRDEAGRPHTDSFIAVEEDRIVHIRTDRPVELAAVTGYEPERPGFELAEPAITEKFARVTNHKAEIKQILEAAGIHVPRGIHITDLTDTDVILDQCRTFHQDIAASDRPGDIVLKPESDTIHGDFVVMGNPAEDTFLDLARETVRQARKMGLSLIVEERIDPIPQPGLTEYNRRLSLAAGTPEDLIPGADELDYNLRVLFTVGEDPVFIDGEVRYDSKCNIPVNVGKSAVAVRTDVIDPGHVIKARETVKQAIAAVYRHVKETGDPVAISEMAGGDCTIDRNGNVYIWELQWGPGGLGSLTKIDKEPATSIGGIYVPYLDATIASQQAQSGHTETALIKIPHTYESMDALAFELYGSRRFREAEILWWANFDLHPSKFIYEVGNLRIMNLLARETGHYQRALDYATTLVNDDPGNEVYEGYKNNFKAGKKVAEIDKLIDAGEYAQAHDELYYSDSITEIFQFLDREVIVEKMEHLARESGQYIAPSEVTAQLIKQAPDNEIFQRAHRKFEAGAALNRVMGHIDNAEYEEAHELFYYSGLLPRMFEYFNEEILIQTMEDIARETGLYSAASEVTARLVDQNSDNEIFQRVHRKFEAGATLQDVAYYLEEEEYTQAQDLLYSSSGILASAFAHFDDEQILHMMATISSHTGQYRTPLSIAQELIKLDAENTTYQRFLTEFQNGFDIAAI